MKNTFHGKPTLLFNTSEGASGGESFLEKVSSDFSKKFNANVIGTMKFPFYNDNFDEDGQL